MLRNHLAQLVRRWSALLANRSVKQLFDRRGSSLQIIELTKSALKQALQLFGGPSDGVVKSLCKMRHDQGLHACGPGFQDTFFAVTARFLALIHLRS